MAEHGGVSPARLLAILLASLVLAPGLSSTAHAACEICDQYTLEIPGPKGDKGGGNGGGKSDDTGSPTSSPAPAAAQAPAPVAAAAPAAEPAKKQKRAKKQKKEKAKRPKPVTTVVEPAAVVSTPLAYEEGSGSRALLGVLGEPGTLALLAIVLAAGGAAFARRETRPK